MLTRKKSEMQHLSPGILGFIREGVRYAFSNTDDDGDETMAALAAAAVPTAIQADSLVTKPAVAWQATALESKATLILRLKEITTLSQNLLYNTRKVLILILIATSTLIIESVTVAVIVGSKKKTYYRYFIKIFL